MRYLTTALLLFSFIFFGSCKKDNIQYNENLDYDTFTDTRDDQTYRSIKIGSQVWMAENLRYHYSPYYSPNEVICCEYGRMYTSGKNKYCPEDWHIPSADEWQVLIEYLGGKEVAGGKLKESGNNHWKEPNIGSTNSSGFTALPAGYANNEEGLKRRTKTAQFWSSTKNPSEENIYGNSYYYISLSYNSAKVSTQYSFDDVDEQYEVRSTRCIKD